MERKYMTLKEVLFGETLSRAYVDLVNNTPLVELGFRVPGMAYHFCTIVNGSTDKVTLIIERSAHSKYKFALRPVDIATPAAWKSILKNNSKLAKIINDIPEEAIGSLNTMSYDDSYLIGGILLNKNGTWPRVMASYKMAYGLSNYLIDLIKSKEMYRLKNQRRWTWEAPSSTIRVRTVKIKNKKGQPDSYPEIRIMRYTNDMKHAIHIKLDDVDVISDDISTWTHAMQTSILDALLSPNDTKVMEFITNVTSVAYKSPEDCGFHSDSDREFTEEALCRTMTQVRMPKYTKTHTPAWVVIPGSTAFEWGLPHMDMVGDIRKDDIVTDDPVIISPCATWHMPVYNKPEQEVMVIHSELLRSKK